MAYFALATIIIQTVFVLSEQYGQQQGPPPPAMHEPSSNCQVLDNVYNYFSDMYQYLNENLNPFYEPPDDQAMTTPTPLRPPNQNWPG